MITVLSSIPHCVWAAARVPIDTRPHRPEYDELRCRSVRLARRFLVSGRVQGVGFRFFTHAAAAFEGLHGWVQNLANGGVEISVEGEAEALERFEHRIRQGPPGSRVETVEVTDEGATGHDSGFHIR
jgi:acylphosphatase